MTNFRRKRKMLLNLYTNMLLNLILKNYFGDQRCLLILSDFGIDYDGDLPSVQIQIINKSVDYNLIFHSYGCQGIVIYSQDPIDVFVEFETQIRLNMERFNRRRFLIATENATKNLRNTFFALKELNYVSDLLLIVPLDLKQQNSNSFFSKTNTIYELRTHRYVGVSNRNQPLLLDKWFSINQTFLFGTDLYPDKLTNQLGRPLRMATFTYEPYSVVGNTTEEHQGSELVSGVQFGLKHNMTPVAVVNENDYWGEIFSNWSGNGLLGNVVEDNADIGFGALYTWEICYHYLDLSKPLVRTGITCLVPAPQYWLAARWLTPLLSFSPHLWIWVIIVLVVSIIILSHTLWYYDRNKITTRYLVKKYHNFLQNSSTIVIKPLLMQALSKYEIPLEAASKLITSLVLVLSFFLTCSYSSGLATVMTLPRYEDPINTVEDFARSALDWGATQDAWITSIQNAKEPNYVKIVSKFHPIPDESKLEQLSTTGEFAFSIERLSFENFAIGSYITEDVIGNFHLMQEDLYSEHCVMMIRKNSILLPFLDLFILKIFEAGLISKWQSKAVQKYMNVQVQRVVNYYNYHKFEQKVVALKWSHVEGAFAVLAIGFGVSGVVFVLELARNVDRYRVL